MDVLQFLLVYLIIDHRGLREHISICVRLWNLLLWFSRIRLIMIWIRGSYQGSIDLLAAMRAILHSASPEAYKKQPLVMSRVPCLAWSRSCFGWRWKYRVIIATEYFAGVIVSSLKLLEESLLGTAYDQWELQVCSKLTLCSRLSPVGVAGVFFVCMLRPESPVSNGGLLLEGCFVLSYC